VKMLQKPCIWSYDTRGRRPATSCIRQILFVNKNGIFGRDFFNDMADSIYKPHQIEYMYSVDSEYLKDFVGVDMNKQ
jgi:hypothetical protein